eukprot:1629845-Prymnesium_polylepis.1
MKQLGLPHGLPKNPMAQLHFLTFSSWYVEMGTKRWMEVCFDLETELFQVTLDKHVTVLDPAHVNAPLFDSLKTVTTKVRAQEARAHTPRSAGVEEHPRSLRALRVPRHAGGPEACPQPARARSVHYCTSFAAFGPHQMYVHLRKSHPHAARPLCLPHPQETRVLSMHLHEKLSGNQHAESLRRPHLECWDLHVGAKVRAARWGEKRTGARRGCGRERARVEQHRRGTRVVVFISGR